MSVSRMYPERYKKSFSLLTSGAKKINSDQILMDHAPSYGSFNVKNHLLTIL